MLLFVRHGDLYAPILRFYHSTELNNEVSSATSIREALKNNQNIDNQVPIETKNELNNLHFIDEYFNILKYKIITEEDLSIYQTVDEGIDNLLKKEIVNATSYDDLIKKIKSKRYTYNKISRMLIHILCNFTKEKANNFRDIVKYAKDYSEEKDWCDYAYHKDSKEMDFVYPIQKGFAKVYFNFEFN